MLRRRHRQRPKLLHDSHLQITHHHREDQLNGRAERDWVCPVFLRPSRFLRPKFSKTMFQWITEGSFIKLHILTTAIC